MLKYSHFHARNTLRRHLLILSENITDPLFLDLLKNAECDDEYFDLFSNIYYSLNHLITFEVGDNQDISEDMHERLTESSDCYNVFDITIPELEPYLHHPLFNTLMHRLQFFVEDEFGGGMDFFYLPTSAYADKDSEPFEKEYANQPCTFSLVSDELNVFSIEMFYDFMVCMSQFNSFIKKLTQ